MGRTGPKPTPTKLKILAGVEKARINFNEPAPEMGAPPRPGHLGPRAAAKWDELAPQLEAMGIFARLDGEALALYCEEYATWLAAKTILRRTGLAALTESGGRKVSPYYYVMRESGAAMLRLLREFGMTPSSRSSLQLEAVIQKADPLDAFLNSRRNA